MKLIIDANELFSIIIAHGKNKNTKKLELLFSDTVELFAPSLLFLELEKNRDVIQHKSGFSDFEFDVFQEILKLRIKILTVLEFSTKLEEAKIISPDNKDIPYFAAALYLDCSLWSGDKLLKEQSKVKVFNTKELVEILNLK